VWLGVCGGIAAYFGIDPLLVRIPVLLVIVWSAGLLLPVYWIVAMIIPEASTPAERAAAHGQLPLNAQDVVDRAKKEYADFKGDRREQRRRWREQRRAWKRQWRASRWQSRWNWSGGWAAPPAATGTYGTRIVTGAMVPILSLVSLLLFAGWAYAVYSLVTTNAVLGQTLPDDLPLWGGILILVIVYQMISWPLHAARRHALFASFGGPHYGAGTAWDGMLSLTFVIFMVWMAYYYIPEVREVIRIVPDVVNSFTR
jgi:phage shock protein PspC (stress-responsive transcriptional regulator)